MPYQKEIEAMATETDCGFWGFMICLLNGNQHWLTWDTQTHIYRADHSKLKISRHKNTLRPANVQVKVRLYAKWLSLEMCFYMRTWDMNIKVIETPAN